MKNKITVSIADQEYTLVATEDEGYMQKVAQHVDAKVREVLDGAKVTLPEEKQAKLKANGAAASPITLGVRPEHLILSGDESSMIHGTVDVSEMMGSAVHLHVSACGSDTIMIVPTTELESTSAFTIGSPIAFTFNGAMAHLFDRNTKKNLEF